MKKVTGTLHEDRCACMVIWRLNLLRKRNVLDTVCWKSQNTLLCLITFFFFRKSCRLWDMWKNITEPDRPQMTIWRKCFGCCMVIKLQTHSEYVTIIAFPTQEWLLQRASILYTRRRGRRRKQILNDIRETRGYWSKYYRALCGELAWEGALVL